MWCDDWALVSRVDYRVCGVTTGHWCNGLTTVYVVRGLGTGEICIQVFIPPDSLLHGSINNLNCLAMVFQSAK